MTLRIAAWCVMGLALLACTPPNFGDDPVDTGDPLAISPHGLEMPAGMSFTFVAAGGTAPYTFSVTGNGSINSSTGKYTAAETPGSATVKVTDHDSEIASTTVTVLPSALWMVPTNPTFEANTAYTFAGHGGTPPYHYTESGIGSIDFNSGVYSSPTGGTTTVSVTDSASVPVTVHTDVVVNPPVFPLQISPTTAATETGTYLGFSASGGTGPYTFSNTGVGSINSSTGLYTAGITAGSATVTVTDSTLPIHNTATASPVTVTAPPPPLTISPSSATMIVGGTQTFTASGGTPPYTFSRTGVGSINSSTGFYSGTTAGSAVVMVTDIESRTASAPVTVTNALGITPSSTSVNVDGTVMLVASGGLGPYTSWIVVGGGAGGTVPPSSSGPTVIYTAPSSVGGTYTDYVRVTDSVPNIFDCEITVTPAALTISPASITLQVGNTVTFTASGGSLYTYSVHSGVGSVTPVTGVYGSGVEGTAIVRVTDNYGRTQDASVTVNPPPLVLSPSSITIQAGGSVTFTAEGGTLPYTYSKVSGVGSIDAISGVFTSMVAGSATVKVTDSRTPPGRTDTATVTVEPPPAPPLNLSPSSVNVQTGSDQTFSATGGTTPFTWDVVQGAAGGTVTQSGVYTAPTSVPSSPTAYTVRVTDSAIPTPAVRTATVNVYAPVVISPNPATVEAGLPVDFNASGGIAPLVFSIIPDDFGSINSSSGLYTAPGTSGTATVRATDSQGKFADWSFTVVDPATWTARQAIEGPKKSGQYASLALDSSGAPQIVYWEAQGKELRIARWTGSWSFSTVDGNNGGDKYASLALDSDGHAHVAWFDDGSNELRYREWNGSSWNSTVTVDTNSNVGAFASLALDGSGNPRIAYYDGDNAKKNLKYAKWVGPNPNNWSIETVESTGDVGQYASLALDPSGNPHIAYYDADAKDLMYIEWDGGWSPPLPVDSAGDVGQYASLKLDAISNPCIAYYDATNKNLKYAERNGSWTVATIDNGINDTGRYASLALDPDDSHPYIAYHDATGGDLKYAEWNTTTWVIMTVDATNIVGQYASIAVDAANRMKIAYYNSSSQDLMYISEQ
jgi:plastocyanin